MNNFILQLVAGLSKTKSKQQIKSDAKSLGDMKFVKLIGNLDMPKTRKAIKAQLKGLNNLTFNITPNVNTQGVQSATKQAINNAQRVANNNKVHLNFDTKIGSLRMRASSGDTDAIEELQEMGEEVDDLATATSNLREKLMALTGVDIMEDEHTFKSYYDQLYEISQVMDKLDDTSRANVLETMFGKSRAAAGAALLSGLQTEGVKAYEDAINSAGSATEEYKAVLLESSFLDSSACSFIYFCTASSVILPIVST